MHNHLHPILIICFQNPATALPLEEPRHQPQHHFNLAAVNSSPISAAPTSAIFIQHGRIKRALGIVISGPKLNHKPVRPLPLLRDVTIPSYHAIHGLIRRTWCGSRTSCVVLQSRAG